MQVYLKQVMLQLLGFVSPNIRVFKCFTESFYSIESLTMHFDRRHAKIHVLLQQNRMTFPTLQCFMIIYLSFMIKKQMLHTRTCTQTISHNIVSFVLGR